MKGKHLLAIGLVVMLLPMAALASGPSVYEMGSKASAQAGAFTARADDATAIFYNPAGIAWLEGMNFSMNMTYINVDGKYESPTMGTNKNNAKNFFVPSLFFSHQVTDRFSYGIGIFAHYNLATDWNDDFPGRFVARHSKIVTQTIRPVFTFKLNANNAISFGLDYHTTEVNLIRNNDTTIFSTDAAYGFINMPFVHSEVSIDTHVKDSALGWNVAYLGKWDPWSFGIRYAAKTKMKFKGHVSFETPREGGEPTSGSLGRHAAAFPGQGVGLTFNALPASAALGIAYSSDPLTVEFDITWTEWSNWSEAIGEFAQHTSTDITVYVPGVGLVPVGVDVIEDEHFLWDWKNTYSYRLGFGYKLSDSYEIYWGILFDEAPVPDSTMTPVLPDADRWSVQVGTGYKNDNWGVDWYLMYLKSDKSNITDDYLYRYNDNGLYTYPTTPDGQYKFTTWLAGFQFNYKF